MPLVTFDFVYASTNFLFGCVSVSSDSRRIICNNTSVLFRHINVFCHKKYTMRLNAKHLIVVATAFEMRIWMIWHFYWISYLYIHIGNSIIWHIKSIDLRFKHICISNSWYIYSKYILSLDYGNSKHKKIVNIRIRMNRISRRKCFKANWI